MIRKLKIKNIIVFATLFVLLGVAVFLERKFDFKDEQIVNKKETSVSIGVGDGFEDWNYGEWEVSAYLSYSGMNIEISEDMLSANIISPSEELYDNGVEVSVFASYTVNTNTSALAYLPGELYYEFPLNMFATNENISAIYDEEEYIIKLYNDSEIQVGYINLLNVSYCTVSSSDECFAEGSEFVAELVDGMLRVYNGVEIASDLEYASQFYVEFSLLPEYVLEESVSFVQPTMSFYDNNKVPLNELEFTYIANTEALSLDGVSSEEQIVYDEWNYLWGNEISGYDYYISYNVAGFVEYSRPYSLHYDLTSNGVLLAYSQDGYNFVTADSSSFDEYNNCSFDTEGWAVADCYLVYGYDFGDSSTFDSYVSLELILSNDKDSVTSSFYWDNYLEKSDDGGGADVSYPSGTNKNFNQSLVTDDAGIGAIDKIRSGKETKFTWKVEPTADFINQTEYGTVKAFNLWNLTNVGTEPYTFDFELTGSYIDLYYNADVDLTPLSVNEYVFESFYLIDDIEYDYVLNSSETSYVLSSSDLDTYTQKSVYVKISDGDYELIGVIGKNSYGEIVYYANDGKTVDNYNVSADNPVLLPGNVTDLKITYEGTKAAVYVGIAANTVLKSSDELVAKVNDLILNELDIVLKNEAVFSVDEEVKSKLTGTYLTSAYEASTYYGSDSVVNDVYVDSDGNKYDSITYSDYVYEEVNYYNGGDSEDALEYLTEQKNVIIYELLPIGAKLDGAVRVSTVGNGTEVNTSVSSIDNYEGTGRTLLKIDVIGVDSNVYYDETYLQSGYNIEFDILYSSLDKQSYGNELDKDMAYYSTGALVDGYVNANDANSSSFSSIAIQRAFAKLHSDNNVSSSVYTTEHTVLSKINITVGTFVKEVKNDLDSDYGVNTNVMESEEYKYRLKYIFSSDYEEITNLVFVDSLENSYDNNSYFKGYFDSIDTSYLNSLGVSTKIYYSTDVNVDLNNIDLNDINSWSTTKPSDVTKIVAVAVSCGNYIFKGVDNVTPMIDINMVASNEYSNQNNKAAYNSSFVSFNYFGDSVTKKMNSDTTVVTLNEATISLDATTSVGNGTEELPAVVEDSYSYNITLSNTGMDYDIEDVSFDVVLPIGLSIDVSEISEISDNVDGVFGTYDYDEDTRILTYSLSSLLKGETKEFSIPVSIDYSTLGNVTSFKAKVQLKTLGGKVYDADIINLYNKLAVPELQFIKFVDTLDTEDFTDETMVIIQKGETYTYRVSIDNLSDITAKNIKVVDSIPEGLTVVESSINNNGIYDSDNNIITWKISQLEAFDTINLDYDVIVPDDIVLGTRYKSSAHIEVVNPIDDELMLYDEDTNIVSTLYQTVSDIKVTNTISGALADTTKEFVYSFEFNGDTSHVGSYQVLNNDGTKNGVLEIDSDGHGTYNAKLRANQSIEFRSLPNGVTYTIKQKLEKGYTTTSDDGIEDSGYVVIDGVTNEVRKINYSYLNSYSVSTTVDISAEVQYDKNMTAGMFALMLTNSNNTSDDLQYADEFGIVNFNTISYDNVDGTFNYVVSQVNTNVKKVVYDTNTFVVSVILTNDGNGTLNKEIKYYNKLGEEVSEIVFKNEYLPNGLVINNVNSSDYVDSSKVFKYRLEITNSPDSVGYYDVVDSKGETLIDLVIDENGEALYEFELTSDERITVLELPEGTNYTVTQELVDYYTTTIEDLNYNIDTDNGVIIYSAVTPDSTVQINFNNNYVTSGEFTPSSVVKLLDKVLEKDEFTFMIKDVSEGLTNGYVEFITNSLEGDLKYTTIEYTRPGTYVYEITQVKGDSNHINYDLSKCILTLVLVDNGNSTMSVLSAKYEYENGKEGFENVYSSEPIVPPIESPSQNENPNTAEKTSKYGFVMIMLIFVCVLFVIERYTRRKRLNA